MTFKVKGTLDLYECPVINTIEHSLARGIAGAVSERFPELEIEVMQSRVEEGDYPSDIIYTALPGAGLIGVTIVLLSERVQVTCGAVDQEVLLSHPDFLDHVFDLIQKSTEWLRAHWSPEEQERNWRVEEQEQDQLLEELLPG